VSRGAENEARGRDEREDGLVLTLSSSFKRQEPNPENSTIYNMCTQKPPYDFSEQLYSRYREAFKTYIATTVRFLARR
jgi:hypothetical protein